MGLLLVDAKPFSPWICTEIFSESSSGSATLGMHCICTSTVGASLHHFCAAARMSANECREACDALELRLTRRCGLGHPVYVFSAPGGRPHATLFRCLVFPISNCEATHQYNAPSFIPPQHSNQASVSTRSNVVSGHARWGS